MQRAVGEEPQSRYRPLAELLREVESSVTEKLTG